MGLYPGHNAQLYYREIGEGGCQSSWHDGGSPASIAGSAARCRLAGVCHLPWRAVPALQAACHTPRKELAASLNSWRAYLPVELFALIRHSERLLPMEYALAIESVCVLRLGNKLVNQRELFRGHKVLGGIDR